MASHSARPASLPLSTPYHSRPLPCRPSRYRKPPQFEVAQSYLSLRELASSIRSSDARDVGACIGVHAYM